MNLSRVALLGGAVTADAVALTALPPPGLGVLAGLRAPHSWVAREGVDTVVARLAEAGLWLVAAWLAAGLVAAALAALPGAVGATADGLSSVLLPRAMRRLLAGTAAVGVVIAPVSAASAVPSVPAPALPAPVVPTGGVATTSPGTATALPAPAMPGDGVPPPVAALVRGDRAGVVVSPGDSLWTITARALGRGATAPAVARAWPRWYAANRAVIGADPDLLLPGERLLAPRPDHGTDER
jgi:nucleoid-associated protein YgaU